MLIHVVVLYGSCATFLALAFATWGPKRRSVLLIWPFLALVVMEALMLSASGHLVAQWLLPLVTMAVVTWGSESDRLVRVARPILFVVAVACCIHGWLLLGSSYAGRGPVALAPGRHASVAWHTPLTGLRPVLER
jgi:hypothetical protein